MVSLAAVAGETTSFLAWRASWGDDAQQWAAPCVLLIAVAVLTLRLVQQAPRPALIPWLALVVGTVLAWPSTHNPLSAHLSSLWWQVVLVSLGILLAATPLLAQVDRRRASVLIAGERSSSARLPGLLSSVSEVD